MPYGHLVWELALLMTEEGSLIPGDFTIKKVPKRCFGTWENEDVPSSDCIHKWRKYYRSLRDLRFTRSMLPEVM